MSVIGVKRQPPEDGRGAINDALAANMTLLGRMVTLALEDGR